MVELKQIVWALLFLSFFSAFGAALTLSELNAKYQSEGGDLGSFLDRFESKSNRQLFEETNGFEKRFNVVENKWTIIGTGAVPNDRLAKSVVNAKYETPSRFDIQSGQLQNIVLIPLSRKGFVFRIGEDKNPFFLVVFVRAGSKNRVGASVQFNERDIQNPSSGLQKNLIKFTYLCYDDGKIRQCAKKPLDLDTDDRGVRWAPQNPIQRVALADWNIAVKDVSDLLKSSDLFSTASPKPRKTVATASAVEIPEGVHLYFYVQRPPGPYDPDVTKFRALNPDELKTLGALGFDRVILPLTAQSRKADLATFIQTLRNARSVQVRGEGQKIVGWVNVVEYNNRFSSFVKPGPINGPLPYTHSYPDGLVFKQRQPVQFCQHVTGTPSPSAPPKLCMDDPKTLGVLAEFYDSLFAALAKKGSSNLAALDGILLDYEAPLSCTCGEYLELKTLKDNPAIRTDASLQKRLVSLQQKQRQTRQAGLEKLYGRIHESVKKHLGEVSIYNTGEDIGSDCGSTDGVNNYLRMNNLYGFIPAPYTLAPFSASGKVARNTLKCYGRDGGLMPLAIYKDSLSGDKCETIADANAAFKWVKEKIQYRGIAVFEYSEWRRACRTSCPDFMRGCKEAGGNVAKAIQKARAA